MVLKELSVTVPWPQVDMDQTWPIRVPHAWVQGGHMNLAGPIRDPPGTFLLKQTISSKLGPAGSHCAHMSKELRRRNTRQITDAWHEHLHPAVPEIRLWTCLLHTPEVSFLLMFV